MSLLLDSDYEILKESGLKYLEDENNRFLILQNYPLPHGLYLANGNPITEVEVLVIIPSNYNTAGTDMLWTYPCIKRADGGPLPNVCTNGGGDNRFHGNREFCRWSRHYEPRSWKPKQDNVQKILDRIEWALQNPTT
jgi:hypothetical protein